MIEGDLPHYDRESFKTNGGVKYIGHPWPTIVKGKAIQMGEGMEYRAPCPIGKALQMREGMEYRAR